MRSGNSPMMLRNSSSCRTDAATALDVGFDDSGSSSTDDDDDDSDASDEMEESPEVEVKDDDDGDDEDAVESKLESAVSPSLLFASDGWVNAAAEAEVATGSDWGSVCGCCCAELRLAAAAPGAFDFGLDCFVCCFCCFNGFDCEWL